MDGQLNEAWRDVLPPLVSFLNAMGFSLFGVNEIGACIMHALFGILSLAFLYLLLRQHLVKTLHLMFFLFLFAAWSPQLLLYFRQSRYYAFMVFGLIPCFYLYERYWQTRTPFYLAAVTLVSALSFFNHYAGGAVTMFSRAAWHLLFRTHETTRREWTAFALYRLTVGTLGLASLVFVGLSVESAADFSHGRYGHRRISRNNALVVAENLDLHSVSCSLRIGSRGRCSSGLPRLCIWFGINARPD